MTFIYYERIFTDSSGDSLLIYKKSIYRCRYDRKFYIRGRSGIYEKV